MTTGAENHGPTPNRWQQRRASLDEQAAAKGTRPIGDGSFYECEELFAEPGELESFLEYVREGRQLGTA